MTETSPTPLLYEPDPARVVKRFTGFSCAHRLWTAASHCRFVHGYERWFEITFEALWLDGNGWVIDFGSMKPLKQILEDQFDHTLIIADNDPMLPAFQNLDDQGAVDLRVMDHPGMEGAARWVFDQANQWADTVTGGRARAVRVVAGENDRNRVEYQPLLTPKPP